MDFWYWLMHQFSAEAGFAYRDWYLSLNLPSFAPEPAVFGIAWGIIYPLIAVAFVVTVWMRYKNHVSRSFIFLFALNVALNLSFSPVLLSTYNNILISLTILSVLVTLIAIEWKAWTASKLIFFLLLPYLLWGSFATALQLSITALN